MDPSQYLGSEILQENRICKLQLKKNSIFGVGEMKGNFKRIPRSKDLIQLTFTCNIQRNVTIVVVQSM